MNRPFPRVFFTLAVLSTHAWAAPFINEFHAENVGPILNSQGATTGISDIDGNSSDWIELRNPDGVAQAINGWALSDDPAVPAKYVIPATPTINVAANGYLLIYASGKNQVRTTPGTQVHTNFKLSNSGAVVLSRPDGSGGWITVHQMGTAVAPYPGQKPRFSYGFPGVSGPAGTPGYLEMQSPGGINNANAVSDFVADTSASVNRGFYSTPFDVTLTTATPGATLIYTTNGSEPTTLAGGGIQVPPVDAATPPTVTLNIAATTVLRVRAVKAGLGATNVDTHSYLFPEQVLQQSAASVTLPYVGWGHDKGDSNTVQSDLADADWAMDPRVVNHANVEDRCVVTDLLEIPTISVVMNWSELFGASGVYIAGEGVDKQASFEVLNPDGNPANPNGGGPKQEPGKMHIYGGTSTSRWKSDKLSINFNFWSDLSSGVLGDSAIGKYNVLVLDARLNQVWNHSQDATQRNRGDFVRDAIVSDLQNAMGSYSPHSQHVHLYLNGLYWGVYTLHEKPEDHFAANYLGGANEDYDVVKHGPSVANYLVAGQVINPALAVSNTNYTAGVNYQNLLNLAGADLSQQVSYDALAAKLDVDDFIKYMLVNFYGGNDDWAHQNWYASYNRVRPEGRWHFHSWDAEHVFKTNNADATRNGLNTSAFADKSTTGPTYIHHRLAGTQPGESPGSTFTTQVIGNAEYRVKFGDAAHQYLFNGGLFTPAKGKAFFEARFNNINEAIRAESARWGDSGPSSQTTPSPELHLRFSDVTGGYLSWWTERQRILNTILDGGTNRTTSLISQLRTRNLYPAFDAPVFGQHGGTVAANYALPMVNPGGSGTIYYTLDGTDPRVPLTGGISASAQIYAGAVPLGSSRTVKARVRNAAGTAWSALNQAYFSVGAVPAAAGNLVISKIHYRPGAPTTDEIAAGHTDRSDFEFIELMNISNQRVDLSGISFSLGLDIAFLPSGVRELAPGERALFVARLSAFTFRYGTGLPVAGEFILGSNLDNNSETLTLVAAGGATIASFEYKDSAPWSVTPDGNGPSLVLMRPATSDPTQGFNWRPSTIANGGPGLDDRVLFTGWQAVHFTNGDPNAGPLMDPDGDGLLNLAEMGLGTDPNFPNPASEQPSVQFSSINLGAGAQIYLTFTCRTVKAAEELFWTAQTTDNPSAGWSSSPADLVQYGATLDNGDGTETRTYRTLQPVSNDAHRFFRAQVLKP